MEEASKQLADSLHGKKMSVELALKAAVAVGGDRVLEDTLRCRLREIDKRIHRGGGEMRTNLRAIALERNSRVEVARAESKAEEARAKELKLLVELRTKEAEIAKSKSKEAALAAKAALESAKKEKHEATLLRAKAEEEDRLLRFGFAACLAKDIRAYIQDSAHGKERWGRCQRLALRQAKMKAGLQRIDVPRFWSATTAGLQQLSGQGGRCRLQGKSETLWASPDFCWELFGEPKQSGKENMWEARYEPRFAFYKVVEKSMPGYFDVLGGRYGVDTLLAECRNILDLAFVSANWRYTGLIQLKYYRCGLAGWPPNPDWRATVGGFEPSGEGVASGGAAGSGGAAAAEPSTVCALASGAANVH